MHQNVNVLTFFNICPKKAVLKKKSLTIFLSSSSLPQQKIHQNIIIASFLCHEPVLFSTRALFCLSHRKTFWIMSMYNVGL